MRFIKSLYLCHLKRTALAGAGGRKDFFMSKPNITFVPVGGLGNRMKAVSSAIRLAHATLSHVDIVWFTDWETGCRFDDLFMPLPADLPVTLRHPAWYDYLLNDRERHRNLHLPALLQRMAYDRRISFTEATILLHRGFNFTAWARGRNVWLASYDYFMSEEVPHDAFSMFTPTESMQQCIDNECSRLPKGTIGVHIRRTDNVRAIEQSPTSLYISRMNAEPEDRCFFLATDSDDVKNELKACFGQRIITPQHTAVRDTVEGMQNALIEMYMLASTGHIIGSSHSTFTTTAAALGKAQLEIISKP